MTRVPKITFRRAFGRRWRPVVLVVLAAMLLLAACDQGTAPDPTPTLTPDLGSYPTIPRVELGAEQQVEYDALITELVGTDGGSGRLGARWGEAFSAIASDATYEPIAGASAYEGEAVASACGSLDTEDASYCAADDRIYYDDNLLRALFADLGPAGPTVVLAHEYGHHLQSIIGVSEEGIAAELQADCFAGMFIVLGMDAPELRADAARIFTPSDDAYRSSEWFAADVHGPPQWRTKAYLDGTLGEGRYCRDYEALPERGSTPVGAYRWLPAPGIGVGTNESGLLIATLGEWTAYLLPFEPAPDDATAAAYLPTVFEGWLGESFTPLGEPIDVETLEDRSGILGGSAAVQGYEHVDRNGDEQHGMLFVHVATTGEVAVVSVAARGPAPSTDPTQPSWQALADYVFLVAFGLCSPDGAAAVCVDPDAP